MGLVLLSPGAELDPAPVGGATRPASIAARAAPREDWAKAHDALFRPDAGEAYIAIDAQIRAVEILSRGVESSPERAYVERCVAHLDGVRDALYELHFGAFDAKTQRYHDKGSALGAYLVAGHLWCRDMLEALRRHLSPPRGSASSRAAALADRSAACVAGYLEPLFRELLLLRQGDPDHALGPILQRAERVHAEIVRLIWALEG